MALSDPEAATELYRRRAGVLVCTTASGGVASPGLGGQRTPRGKGKGKDMGITTYGLTRHSWRATSWEKVLSRRHQKAKLKANDRFQSEKLAVR